jgi:hypothetical protein
MQVREEEYIWRLHEIARTTYNSQAMKGNTKIGRGDNSDKKVSLFPLYKRVGPRQMHH